MIVCVKCKEHTTLAICESVSRELDDMRPRPCHDIQSQNNKSFEGSHLLCETEIRTIVQLFYLFRLNFQNSIYFVVNDYSTTRRVSKNYNLFFMKYFTLYVIIIFAINV